MKKSVVLVKNLTKKFKVEEISDNLSKSIFSRKKYHTIEAVKGISFDIYREEFVGFIGQNGAGKTTTLKCLTGLLTPDTGMVEVLGYVPHERKHSFLQQISLLMGNRSQLWWELPAIESFRLNKEIYQIDDNNYNEVLEGMVETLEIKDIIYTPVRKLSLGERMKCELVMSLLHMPKVLFLDEPTLGLDILSQQKLRDFLSYYHQRYNTTTILTSHNMEDIKNLCKRVIIIDKGEILYDGRLSNLTQKFAREKYLTFTLPESRSEKEIGNLGKVLEFNGKLGLILVERNRVRSAVKKLLDDFNAEDIDIQEPSLENVVKNIFSGKY